MIIIDYIPENSLLSKGHYQLQDKWIKELVVNKKFIYKNRLNFFNFIRIWTRVVRKKEGCFYPNMSLFDRHSIFNTLLVIFTPFSQKVVILHTVSKINFLNKLFILCTRNCRFYSYSNSLTSYMSEYNSSDTNEFYIAKYLNAERMLDLVKEKAGSKVRLENVERSRAIIWGNPVKRIDEKRISKILDIANFKMVTIISKDNDSVIRLSKKYPNIIKIVSHASDLELAEYLLDADVNLMCFDADFDFYISKKASSGVYLTSLKFGIPTIAWFNAGSFGEEMEQDGLSRVVSSSTSLEEIKKLLKRKRKYLKDPFKRYEIDLEGCD